MRSPVDLTYLGDAVILLRFFEHAGSLKKAISVIKKRTGHHEDTIRELSFVGGKVVIGKPLYEFSGIMTGTPRFTGSSANMLKEAEYGTND